MLCISAVYAVSVCPSVLLSVTFVYCVRTSNILVSKCNHGFVVESLFYSDSHTVAVIVSYFSSR